MNSKNIEHALYMENLLAGGLGAEVEITSVTYDSRQVTPGCLFICKGQAFKKEYLMSAVEQGAVAYLAENNYDVSVPCMLVTDIRKAMAVATSCFYGYPSHDLQVIGITGTKGKTTTAFITRALLAASGKRFGLMSSVMTDTGRTCEESHLTTPESPDLQKMLYEMREEQLSGVVMEVSSQGLAYDRVLGVKFASAAFLNIGQDHISPIEHNTFEEYFDAKKRIFSLSNRVCINLDDEFSKDMVDAACVQSCEIVTFGFSQEADVRAYDLNRKGDCTVFRVRTSSFDRQFTLPLIGAFNVYNALAAICLCMNIMSVDDMIRGMKSVRVPGRMEVIQKKDITVIVDYAHNKLSFESLFSDMRKEYPGRRLISIYGCPGGKAFLRRTDLGEVSGRLADHTILTAEDPNFEDVEQINNEIGEHIHAAGGSYDSIPDREQAIKTAILQAKSGDVIIITGKGEETYQKVNGVYEPFEGDIPLSKKYLAQR